MRVLIAARNRAVAVEDGHIIAQEGAFDVVLEFPDADVRPGLINAHDHLHRNHYGRLGEPPYGNAYEWAEDIQTRYRPLIAERKQLPRRDALLTGAWKNLLSGVTSVMHHDPWEPDFEVDFPLRVLRVRNADSLGMAPALDGVDGKGPFCLHVAEGVDARAAGEVQALDELGLLTRDLIAVHGVGIEAQDIERFRGAGAALTWCPTSNLFLFGRTAAEQLLGEGMDVLLGSDSLLTGAGNLLDELRCARQLGYLSDERLEDAVGAAAARRFGTAIPSLEPGAEADLVLLSRPLLEARAADVLLVLVGGVPRVAEPGLVPRLGRFAPTGCESSIGPVVRWVGTGYS